MKRASIGITLGLVLGLALGAGACGAGPQRDKLMESVETYNDGVRWQRFSAAAAAVPPAERSQFLDDHEALADDLKITDYEVVRVAAHDERAEVQVKLTWFLDSRGTVHDTWVRQQWERQGGGWRVVDERRVRGEPMPGLAEEVEADADADTDAQPAVAPGHAGHQPS